MLYSMEPEKNKVSRVNSFFIKKWFGYRVVMLFYGEFQVVVIVCRVCLMVLFRGKFYLKNTPYSRMPGTGCFDS